MFEKPTLPQRLFERRGLVLRPIATDRDYDYYDLNDEDIVSNPIVGIRTVGDIRELRRRGALIFQRCWRVPSESYTDDKMRKKVKATDTFLQYKKHNFKL